jgi:putative endonuclease
MHRPSLTVMRTTPQPASTAALPSVKAAPSRAGSHVARRCRALGRRGEQLAAGHLERLGYEILARNVRTRAGEIDLIALGERTLVFVEVKTRRVHSPAPRVRPEQEPLPWLRPRQRARLRGLAAAWLSESQAERPWAELVRFDAIGVLMDGEERLLGLEHLEGAW